MMHNGIPYDPIQDQGQGHVALKVRNSSFFKISVAEMIDDDDDSYNDYTSLYLYSCTDYTSLYCCTNCSDHPCVMSVACCSVY